MDRSRTRTIAPTPSAGSTGAGASVPRPGCFDMYISAAARYADFFNALYDEQR